MLLCRITRSITKHLVVKCYLTTLTVYWISKMFLWLTYPPIEMPVIPRGQYPSLSSQRSSTVDSRIKAPPITNRSDTFFRLDRLKHSNDIYIQFTIHSFELWGKIEPCSLFLQQHPTAQCVSHKSHYVKWITVYKQTILNIETTALVVHLKY